LLYWYKSTNTDADGNPADAYCETAHVLRQVIITCFTGTKVQILTPIAKQLMFSASYDFDNPSEVLQITCFTGTKVQMLTPDELQAEEASYSLRPHTLVA
jgi:hypothetical protein